MTDDSAESPTTRHVPLEMGTDRQVVVQGLEDLVSAIRDSNEIGHGLQRQLRSRDWMIGIMAMLLVALIAVTAVDTVRTGSLSSIAATNRERNRITSLNTAAIKDCTTPGGACYERQQRDTQAAIAAALGQVQLDDRTLICNVLKVLPPSPPANTLALTYKCAELG